MAARATDCRVPGAICRGSSIRPWSSPAPGPLVGQGPARADSTWVDVVRTGAFREAFQGGRALAESGGSLRGASSACRPKAGLDRTRGISGTRRAPGVRSSTLPPRPISAAAAAPPTAYGPGGMRVRRVPDGRPGRETPRRVGARGQRAEGTRSGPSAGHQAVCVPEPSTPTEAVATTSGAGVAAVRPTRGCRGLRRVRTPSSTAPGRTRWG
jgi:hypothetical protein